MRDNHNYNHNNNSSLFVHGCSSATELAQRIALIKEFQCDNRPFVVMDTGRVAAALNEWQQHLPDVEPFFSIRCNSDAVLLEQLASHPTIDVGFNCTTRRDLRRALEIVAPRRVLYANPFLTNSSLNEARALDANLVAFESLADLKRISLNHAGAEIILNLGLLSALSEDDEKEEAVVERAEQLLQTAADSNCRCVGLALGSFVEESARGTSFSYSQALAICRRLFQFARKTGCNPLNLIHLGDLDCGGEDFANIANEIRRSLEALFPREEFPVLRVIATPSRGFCNAAFSLVTRVTGQRLVETSVFTNDEFDAGSNICAYQVNDEGCFGVFALADETSYCRCQPLFSPSSLDTDYTYAAVIGASFDYGEARLLQPPCKQIGQIGLTLPYGLQSWLVWPEVGAYSFNNGEDLEVDGADGPQVFYFAAGVGDEWNHFQKPMPEAPLADMGRCMSPANSDCGFNESLVSDDVCSLDSNMEQEKEWALDWLNSNDFGY